AVQLIRTPLEKMQICQLQRLHALDQLPEKRIERLGIRVEIHERQIFPRIHARRHEPILRTIESAYSIEIRRALERAVDSISPTMIWAAEIRRLPCCFRHHR